MPQSLMSLLPRQPVRPVPSAKGGVRFSYVKKKQVLPNELTRRFEELVSYLFLEDDFPDGVVLCSGTALVPERPFTRQPGDIVQITIDQPGTLRTPVVRGKWRPT